MLKKVYMATLEQHLIRRGCGMTSINNLKIKCDFCGKSFKVYEKRKDGMPNGMRFELKDGSYMNVCADCFLNDDQYRKVLKVVNKRV